MKIILSFISAIIFFVLMTGCTPDNPASTGTSSPFTLKYEITTSSPVLNPSIAMTYVAYNNGTGQTEYDNSWSGTIWTKEVTVTTPNRPFFALLNPSGLLSSPGTVKGNIYVNGQIVATVTNPTITQGSSNIVNLQMNYIIN